MGEKMTMRKPEHPINPLFLNRWSPRAMSGEPISDAELMALFEAAKWAPSSYNNQPWRFLYAKRDTPQWDIFFGLLGEFNQSWCKNAAALIVVCALKNFTHNGKPSRTHDFDAGAAWMSLALQGSMNGLVVHGMEGFDYDKARTVLKIPEDVDVECMVAVGKPGKRESLPAQLQEREVPSDRKKLKEIVYGGMWNP